LIDRQSKVIRKQKAGIQMHISSDNQIHSRRYNLEILQDGEVVEHEYSVTDQEKDELIKEYHSEGKTVNSTEVFSVTKNSHEIGNNPVDSTKPYYEGSEKVPSSPAASPRKIANDRELARARQIHNADSHNKLTVDTSSNGRRKNSPLHAMWIAAMKERGFKIHNLITGKYFYGFKEEVMVYLLDKINKHGYKYEDFEIKYLGKRDNA
jgi:hypothetical protein